MSPRSCHCTSQKLDPGAAVALGAPLLVRLFVPLWVVNATPLPLAAWVVPVQPPRGSPERGDPSARAGSEADLTDAAEGMRLHVMETEPPSAASPGRRGCDTRIPHPGKFSSPISCVHETVLNFCICRCSGMIRRKHGVK